jgi:hypothetical protein
MENFKHTQKNRVTFSFHILLAQPQQLLAFCQSFFIYFSHFFLCNFQTFIISASNSSG